jgi:predicted dinucleotide-binding enzyme
VTTNERRELRMATVGFIGSGNIGTTIARLAVEAGHQVVLSNSRSADTLADTVAQQHLLQAPALACPPGGCTRRG